jgi:hypothetical protein
VAENPNPYHPPSAVGPSPSVARPLNWTRFSKSLGFWLIGTTVLGGVGITLWVGERLSPFGAFYLLPRVIAVSIVHALAARAAGLSVCLALVTYGHREHLTPEAHRALIVPTFALVPLVAVIAAPFMLLVSIILSASYFGVASGTFWTGLSIITLADVVSGFVMACVHGSLLALIAAFGLPALSRRVSPLWGKLAVTSTVLLLLMKLVDVLAAR